MKIDADEKELLECERTRYARYAKATFRKDLEAIEKRALAEGTNARWIMTW